MPRYAQIVMGPAGSGKSTYCSNIQKHCEALRQVVHVVNLDPAAEAFDYPVLLDIRDLISIDDVLDDKELKFGPNGGLVYCMEFLVENLEWLKDSLDDIEDDYIIFDCPGQIELYTHLPVMPEIVSCLKSMNFEVCGVFILDAQFLVDAAKLVSGFLTALSTMLMLEIPHVNVLSKVDLLSSKADLYDLLEPDLHEMLAEQLDGNRFLGKRYKKLNHAFAELIHSHGFVKFLPLERDDEGLITDILAQIDNAMNKGEHAEHREPKEVEEDDD